MSTPEELCTECLQSLNEAEDNLSEAKGCAQSATNEANSAEDYAAEARSSADNADDYCGYCAENLSELRTQLEELSTQLESPEDSLAANMARHKKAVMKHHEAGWPAQRIATKFDISTVLVDLIISQTEREAVSA